MLLFYQQTRKYILLTRYTCIIFFSRQKSVQFSPGAKTTLQKHNINTNVSLKQGSQCFLFSSKILLLLLLLILLLLLLFQQHHRYFCICQWMEKTDSYNKIPKTSFFTAAARQRFTHYCIAIAFTPQLETFFSFFKCKQEAETDTENFLKSKSTD